MKIVEKKCPNCHANLEFKVGESDIRCPNCRREYAVEYDKDFVDPEVQIKAKDIQLKVLDDIAKARVFNRVFFVVVFIFTAVIICISIVMAVRGYEDYRQTKEEMEQSQQEHEAQFERMWQEAEDQYNKSKESF